MLRVTQIIRDQISDAEFVKIMSADSDVSKDNDNRYQFSFVVKGPAADATDAPQP
jgi:hypothetical protein